MFELFASRLSRCVVALALFFAAVVAFVSPASARPHHRHSAERHAYVHHARHHHYRHHARSSRFERSAARLQASGFANTQASYDPNANSGGMATNGIAPSGLANNAMSSGGFGGGSGLVSEARRYLGGNPTGRGSLWCARFMNMVLQHTGHQGTGSDMASSFARYGTRISGPQVGAIAVMSRGGRGGHVGIISGIDARGNPIMISGNNGNRVREAPVSRGKIYAYVMPN
ncbi:TIGR02594 family protein [Bradyrhizobium sp. 180]|uniref:TIGR02594 family protein n=1 Tax=unclassified Bradyrhizobium TaxID=2631580 RepID=UPI001FF71F1D|nr:MULTISPECIES: TIGR02594 family protein [unclassified Bradyrhizobium]MCK1423310.1 TIGR02594 family protein [Bradyrhizobium sp. CW12]MCK1493701.1 TIGR02594 family protein [Bradyrhizobium sp. 180]MCK1528139.1 TIGR02594 family protein [Bradyrhizobium sp. 182]MCK1598564.1 TIGR02594 family protein [Bradyrhizobium sp. 164]MCK1617631.1 TIGR02594 family protein [Bradyrhizobium sp. 159]